MNQAEVVRPEVEGHGSLQIGQLAREGQSEPVKSSNLHPQRQILPLHIGRTNLAVVWDPEDFCNLRARHLRRSIAAWARVGGCIKLRDLGIGRTIAKIPRN